MKSSSPFSSRLHRTSWELSRPPASSLLAPSGFSEYSARLVEVGQTLSRYENTYNSPTSTLGRLRRLLPPYHVTPTTIVLWLGMQVVTVTTAYIGIVKLPAGKGVAYNLADTNSQERNSPSGLEFPHTSILHQQSRRHNF